MPKLLPKIKYSLTERGRVHTGINRDDINVKAIVANMNSPECQERIKNRDAQGYLGHWARAKFHSLKALTGGVVDGKPAYIQPALVTTYLKAYPDGTVEHQSELLDTEPGLAAQKMWDSKVGGFSSAIDLTDNKFYGFDYVPDPNYVNNSFRGAMFDSSTLSIDEIDSNISDETLHGLMLVLNQKEIAFDAASSALNQLAAENEELLSLLSQRNIAFEDAGGSAHHQSRCGISVALDSTQHLQDIINSFDSATLPCLVNPEKAKQNRQEIENNKIIDHWKRSC